jgi:hypothetical protein
MTAAMLPRANRRWAMVERLDSLDAVLRAQAYEIVTSPGASMSRCRNVSLAPIGHYPIRRDDVVLLFSKRESEFADWVSTVTGIERGRTW